MITQILVGLMLLFGAATLFPKAYLEYSTGKRSRSIVSFVLGCAALFFSMMAFYYAYLILDTMLS